MRAWISSANSAPLELVDLPAPVPSGSEVVVETEFCGVCHSDLHTWQGVTDLGSRGKVTRPASAVPVAMGHEISGRVSAKGPDATGVEIGDRVIVYPWLGCGSCGPCTAGQDNMCIGVPRSLGFRAHGGFASKVVVPHPRYLVEVGDLDPALAATLACSGLTVMSAIRKLMPLPADEPVVVIGAGGVGLQAIAVLRAMGHEAIISVDLREEKRALAMAEGATAYVPGGPGASERLTEVAGGKVGAVLDFVNNGETATMAFDVLRKGGTMVQVGLFGGELAVPLYLVALQALTIRGSLTGTLEDLAAVVALARSGKLRPVPIERLPKDQINEAMLRLERGEVSGRLVLQDIHTCAACS